MVFRHLARPARWIPVTGLLVLMAIPVSAAGQPPTPASCDGRLGKDPNDPGAVACYIAAGKGGPGRMESVVRHLQQRMQALPADPHTQLALGYLRAGRLAPDAAGLLTAAAEAYARQGNALGEVLARCSLATFLRQTGKTASAASEIAAAMKAAETAGSPRLVAWASTTDAWQAYTDLDYGRALARLESVRDTIQSTDDRFLRTSWMSARGGTLWALGRYTEARKQYEEEAAFHRSGRNFYDEATARLNIVLLARGEERRSLALQAAQIAQEAGNLAAEANAYFYLAGYYPPDEGLAFARKGLALAIASGIPDVISRHRGRVAQLMLPADPEGAFRLIDEAIREAEPLSDRNQVVRHHLLKSIMRWRTGPRVQAMADSIAAFDAIEALRTIPREEEIRAERFAQWRSAYYRQAGHLLAGHHAPTGAPTDEERDMAFRTMERMRARLLLDRMDVAGASSPADAGSSSHVEGLAAIRAALRPDEALISYHLATLVSSDGAPFGAWVWTITRERVEVSPVSFSNTLAAEVDVFLGLIQRRDGSEAPAAARLYADYLAPATRDLPPAISRLIVIPDDALHRVPFAVLRESASGPTLGDRFDVSVIASASLWARWRQTTFVPGQMPALVLADPSLPSVTTAASTEREADELAPLPNARVEARAVARAIGRGSDVFSGREATEARVKQAALNDYRLLHFAAHVVIDDRSPAGSAVILGAGEGQDGRLQIREIVDLPLSGQTVLLSACRSASGTVVSGEGALGLAHAFFRGGARAVVATLWTVRDRDAGVAFSLVAEALGRGASVASAVAQAQRTMVARGEPAAAWAGLVVMGDGNLVPFPGGRPIRPEWWHVLFTGLLITTLVGWIGARRRQRLSQKAAPQMT